MAFHNYPIDAKGIARTEDGSEIMRILNAVKHNYEGIFCRFRLFDELIQGNGFVIFDAGDKALMAVCFC